MSTFTPQKPLHLLVSRFAGLLRAGALGLLPMLLLSACDTKPEDTAPAPSEPTQAEDPALAPATVDAWLAGVNILDVTLGEAQSLGGAIQALLENPSKETLNATRLAWQRSHDAYSEFELFTTLSESNPGLFGALSEYDFAIDAWPIQPGYLDYYDVYTHSGIVNDIAMPLTAEALRQQHGFTDAADVSLGFHALEYLLWGEQGERPASDYQEASLEPDQRSAGMRRVELPNNRRRALLTLLANLLLDDIETFKEAMEKPDGMLRSSYLALQPHSRVTLLQTAGHLLLNRHRDRLQAQLENSASKEADPDSAGKDNPSSDDSAAMQHNRFAGKTANALAHSLLTVEEVLLQSEEGFGNWTIDPEQGDLAREQLAQLRAQLLAWNDQPWPPESESGTDMANTLGELAELLAPKEI